MIYFLKYRVLVIFVIACLLQTNVIAQAFKDTLHLNEIEFSAKRLAKKEQLNIIKLDSAILAENKTATLGELLNRSTPAFIKSYGLGGISTPAIRGTGASHTKIYWNNLPLNSSARGTSDLSLVPAFLLDDVELQYGTSSLEQGSGGIGASINLTSNSAVNKPVSLQLQQSFGSFGTYTTFLGGNYSMGEFYGSSKVYYQKAKNNYTFKNTALFDAPMQEQQSAAWEQKGLMQQLGYAFTPNSNLNFTYWYQKTARDLPSQMFILLDSASQEDYSSIAMVEYKYSKFTQDFSIMSSFTDEYLRYKNPLKSINSLSKGKRLFSQVIYKKLIGSKLAFSSQFINNISRMSAEDFKSSSTPADRRQDRSSIFAGLSYEPNQRIKYELDVRQELINSQLMPLTFTASTDVSILQKDKLKLFASAGRNFNYPALNDLYWIPGGNPELKPEKSWSAETGLSTKLKTAKGRSVTASVAAFNMLVDDWIQWRPGNSGYWEAQNLRKVWSRGLESKLGSQLFQSKDITLNINFAYTYTLATNLRTYNPLDKSLNKQLIYVPKHVFRSMGRLGYRNYFATLEYNLNGITYTSTDNSAELPYYSLLHLTAGRKIKVNNLSGNIILKVNNLLNTSYQVMAWYPMPGRYYELTLRFDIKAKRND